MFILFIKIIKLGSKPKILIFPKYNKTNCYDQSLIRNLKKKPPKTPQNLLQSAWVCPLSRDQSRLLSFVTRD